ncbi:hypothetical protein FT663_03321 [Candidozyma haemuli var. vulneris]|uniref:Uncharacterized protein n=1 Tax=Candidozyma haemuli TaxID=45357 RepID=A0A2V1AWT8_9ASCO|nr:hypothetical protein CXQ85_000305 [[Candida] haemuloni]KAF3988469.1 hypothetical protein FT662_03418 [[Candida] haemuloni var. vulneris]KAF3990172.1 hypothetical protein FT663_03321 [[Candida] haemuloni var. vulneris]PVH21331.1 hypothetical protein CXQ85_000305 [[Candida] haemuloni]
MHRSGSFSSQQSHHPPRSALARSAATEDLFSVEDRVARKPKQDNHGQFYFPNGEVFRPRNTPSRRHRPSKIHPPDAAAPPASPHHHHNHHNHPNHQHVSPVAGPSSSYNPIPGVPYNTGGTFNAVPGGFNPGFPGQGARSAAPRSNSLASNSSARSTVSTATTNSAAPYMTRSHSFHNLKAKSRSDLAQSLRNNRVDTNINISNFSAPSSTVPSPQVAARPHFQPPAAHSYNAVPSGPAFLHARSHSLSNNKYPENSTNIVKSESSLYTSSSFTDASSRGRQSASSDSKNSSLSSYNLNRSSSNTPQTSVTTSENHDSKETDSKENDPEPDHVLPTCSSLESIREGAAKASDYIADSCPNPQANTTNVKTSDSESSLEIERSSTPSSFTSAEYGDASGEVLPEKRQLSVHEETHSGNGSSAPNSPPASESITSSPPPGSKMPSSTTEAELSQVENDTASLSNSTHSASCDRTVFTTPTSGNTESAATSISQNYEKGESSPTISSSSSATAPFPTQSNKHYKSMLLDDDADSGSKAPITPDAEISGSDSGDADLKHHSSIQTSLQDSTVTISQNMNNSSETLGNKTRPKPATIDTNRAVNLDEEVFTPCSEYSFAAGEEKLICKSKDDPSDSETHEEKAPTNEAPPIKREKTDASISNILDAYSEEPVQGCDSAVHKLESHDAQDSQHSYEPQEPLESENTESENVPNAETDETRPIEKPLDSSKLTDGSLPDVPEARQTTDKHSVSTEEHSFESSPEKPLPEASSGKSNDDTLHESPKSDVEIPSEPKGVESTPEGSTETASIEDAPDGEGVPMASELTKRPPPLSLEQSPVKNLVAKDESENNNSLIRNRLSMLNVVNVDFDKSLPTTPDNMKFTVAMPDSVSPASKKSLSPQKPQLQRNNSMSKSFSINNFKKVFGRFGNDAPEKSSSESISSKKESFGSKLLKKKSSFSADSGKGVLGSEANSSSTSLSTTQKKGKRKFFKTLKFIPGAKQEEVTSPVYSVRAKVPSPVLDTFPEESPALNPYRLPDFETEEDGFSDLLLKFDEVEKEIELEDEQSRNKPKANAFFMRDDELTKAQIADQQRNDNHNSDDSLPEKFEESTDDSAEQTEEPEDVPEREIPWSPGYDEYASGVFTPETDEGPKRVQSLKLDKNELQDMLEKKAHSNHFIKHVRQMRDMDSVEIVVEAFNPNEKVEENAESPKEMNSILRDASLNNGTPGKAVKFSSKVSISETYPSYVYRRYNKSVTQYYLTETGEVNKIKNELNAYKCYEMLVHEKSQNNTQFFY